MNLKALSIVSAILTLGIVSHATGQELPKPESFAKEREIVITANPLATEAGEQILKNGGTATDAMIVIQTILGLVEPQSSGIGGGAFIVYYDRSSGKTITLDAREKAPASASEERFLDNGKPVDFDLAWQSGLSVGVPGVPKMMEYMHQKYGRLPWKQLFEPARILAQEGFMLTERTNSVVTHLLKKNASCVNGKRLFFRDQKAFDYLVDGANCTAKRAGTLMQNLDYAELLEAMADRGAKGFYYGDIAKDIQAAVQGDLNFPGDLTIVDLANYQVEEREPVCFMYKAYQVCGMGPPSSGALAVGQILGMLEQRSDLMGKGPLDTNTVHLFTQAGWLAFADRNRYLADSDFITVPLEGLLNKQYLKARAALIKAFDIKTVLPGNPPGNSTPQGSDQKVTTGGTSHVSIIDRYGNALSMTTSVEGAFGNGVMVRGFFLNNQLTDFSFPYMTPEEVLIANRVQPNKRPRSSMSPIIVFDKDKQVKMVTGSPGGSRIIGYTAQSIMNVLHFGLDPQEAIDMPHFMKISSITELEQPDPEMHKGYGVERLSKQLVQRGHNVSVRTLNSGLSTILVISDGKGGKAYLGGADKRRDGTVGGQ